MIPPLLLLGLVLTNDAHHLFWLGFSFDGTIQPLRGSANWISTTYGYLLAMLSLSVFIWLFIRSPLHRASVAIILFGMVTLRAAYLLDVFHLNLLRPMDPVEPSMEIRFIKSEVRRQKTEVRYQRTENSDC